MERRDLEDLRDRVPCAAVLAEAGYAIDVKQSTRRAAKYRRDGEIIIVIHDGRGWFDPLSEAKGDVFGLVRYIDGCGFIEAVDRVAALAGHVSVSTCWKAPPRKATLSASISKRWAARSPLRPGSTTWQYLQRTRLLPDAILRAAIRQNVVREGPCGSLWAAHLDDRGVVTGWEERGPEWRGFSSGGAKVLFRLGSQRATRLCVTEAAIDAMSLAAIEELRTDSLYLSTGGGWSPRTEDALRNLATRPDVLLVAATDGNPQGELYAERLRQLADRAGCGWCRLRPAAGDWNDELGIRI